MHKSPHGTSVSLVRGIMAFYGRNVMPLPVQDTFTDRMAKLGPQPAGFLPAIFTSVSGLGRKISPLLGVP